MSDDMPDFELDVDNTPLSDEAKRRVHDALKKAIETELAASGSSSTGARPAADVKGHGKAIRQLQR
jgi:hypothetical protein